jgi:alpha-amylase
MPSVCIYFQVHQPNRLKEYTFFDIGKDHFYENDNLNRDILNKVSEKCYLPANKLMLELIKKHEGKFKIAFSLSGVFIEQLENHRPDVLQSFIDLAETGCVEFLTETYYHSLAYNYSKQEFVRQVELHEKKIMQHFNQKPKIFRNTELIYFNELGKYVEDMGYKGILAEGVDWYLLGRTPNVLYKAPNAKNIKILLKNYKLSDDIAFRFTDTNWKEHPLTPVKYAGWINKYKDDVVNLFMDYETIGEHHWKHTGIFEFWNELPEKLLKHKNIDFKTPSEVVDSYNVKDTYDVHCPISWADTSRDLSAWVGNNMQHEAITKLYSMEDEVLSSKNPGLIHVWSKLQTSDHFYYMSTKHMGDGAVHAYFSPYGSPYDSYIFYMNALSDLELTCERWVVE